jgi:hypothetical protein
MVYDGVTCNAYGILVGNSLGKPLGRLEGDWIILLRRILKE